MAFNLLTGKTDRGFAENLGSGDIGGLAQNIWQAARDEYLGVDDARRAISKLREGNFMGALKSLATGGLELGFNVLGPLTPAAKAAKLPGLIRIPAKIMGTGAKTPLRGLAINTGFNIGAPAVLDAALPRLPGVGRMFQAAAPAPLPDPFALTTIGGQVASPPAANQEALIQLMMQQGVI